MLYNLSTIARRANALARDMGKSAAFKKAWAEEKIAVAEAAPFMLEMQDRWDAADFEQSRELNAVIAAQSAAIAPALTVVPAPRKELTWEEELEAFINANKSDPLIRNLGKAA
jgi:hypothetical protein